MDNNELFTEPIASKLEGMRATARTKRRITYDCLNAIVTSDRVKCRCNHFFKRPGAMNGDGSTDLHAVLKGRSPLICAKCTDYDHSKDE